MNIPALTFDELDLLDNRASRLLGRNLQLGMDFICELAPGSVAAAICMQATIKPPARLSFKQLSLIDVTGSLDAGISLMNWIFDDVLVWTMDTFVAGSKAQAAGSHHFSFDRPDVHVTGQGLTPYTALMRAILSGIRWEVRKTSPLIVAEERDQGYEVSYVTIMPEEIPLDRDGNPILPPNIDKI